MTRRDCDGFKAAVGTELGKNFLYVVSNSEPADVELFSDSRRPNALGQQLDDMLLSPGKSLGYMLFLQSGSPAFLKPVDSSRELLNKMLHYFALADISKNVYER